MLKFLLRAGLTVLLLVAALVGALLAVIIADEDLTDTPEMEFNTGQGVTNRVPVEFRPWLLKAAKACDHRELSAGLLAAQLQQESGFSTSRSTVSVAGAQGPAQFMPATWPTWGRDDDDNGRVDPYDAGDAVMAQGRLMCSLIGQARSSGYGGDPRRLALAGYNAGWGAVQRYRGVPPYTETQNYVRVILASAKSFTAKPTAKLAGSSTSTAVRTAAGRIGTPYSWGGGSPDGPSRGFCSGGNGVRGGKCVAATTSGFDCSSLVQYAYWPDVKLPRTAEEQYRATADRSVARGDLQAGDLLFWRNASGGIYHVAIYDKSGRVIHAPRTGKNVENVSADVAMPKRDYFAATRP